jgi:hypothetical protein
MHSRSNQFQTFRQDRDRLLTRLDREESRLRWVWMRRFRFQRRAGGNLFRRFNLPVPLFRSSLDRMTERLYLGRQDRTRRG